MEYINTSGISSREKDPIFSDDFPSSSLWSSAFAVDIMLAAAGAAVCVCVFYSINTFLQSIRSNGGKQPRT